MVVFALVVAFSGALTRDAPAATPTFGSVSSAATAAQATSLTINRPSATVDGQVLLAVVAYRLDGVSAISPPAGWSDVVRTACSSTTGSLTQATFVKVASPGEPADYTFGLATATGAVGVILAYSGVDLVRPIDATAGRITRNSKGIIAPSVTTTVPGTRIVGAFAHSGSSAISPPTGMAVRGGATTGASAPSATMTATDQLLASAGPTGDRKAGADQANACSVGQLVALRPGPDVPVATSPPTVTGTPREGETLTATTGSWSGSPISYAYQWQRSQDGASWTAIQGATGSTYVLASGEIGAVVRVSVTASNAGGSGTASSQPTAVVLPSAPVNTSLPTVTGAAREGETLTATPGAWSGSPTTYAYGWQRSTDGGGSWTDIQGATGSSYVLTTGDVGSIVRVGVTASNAGGSASASSAPTAAVEDPLPPSNVEPPAISGVAQEGETLTALEGTWTGPPPTYAYAWEVCDQDGQNCSALPGADARTYEPTAADVGFTLRVLVTASNASGSSGAISAATGVVLVARPVSTEPPFVTGVALEGETLVASAGEWTGSPTSFSYQWERCDVNGQNCWAVTWANTATNRLRAGDVGLRLRVVVTASNAGGPSSAASAVTDVVLPLPPVNETPPTVSGVLEEGETVTASPGGWLSSGPLTYAHQWQRSEDGGASWTDIAGADASTYQLTGDDVGSVVRVAVTASNTGGSASAVSDATAPISSPGRPVSVDPPSFSGYAQLGRVLTAVSGSWSGSPTSYAYQWQRSTDGGATWADIEGAASASYISKSQDLGADLRVLVTATNEFGSTPAPSYPAEIYPTGNLIVAVNLQWRCSGAVSLDLVKVTMTTRLLGAVAMANGCTGRVGRVEVDTWTYDALDTLNASANAAHDFVIESGYAICHDLAPSNHQDGYQAMGGARIIIRNFVIACGDMADEFGTGVADSVLIARGGAGATTPTDIVLEHSVLMPGAAHTFAVGESLRSGIRQSVLCPDRTGTSPFVDFGGAVDPVYEANEEPDLSDPRCSSFAAALAWAGGSAS